MKTYQPKKFTIPALKGISETTIEEHIKLYEGYVKHANLIQDKIWDLSDEKHAYELSELRRRFGFEFDGMRNHELYFGALEGGPMELDSISDLHQKITEDFEDYEAWLGDFKRMAKTRGIGWVILYYDPIGDSLINAWVDEQHLGHLVGLTPILALDMWEHSFVADYQPSGKASYIDDYMEQINWTFVEKIFDNVYQ